MDDDLQLFVQDGCEVAPVGGTQLERQTEEGTLLWTMINKIGTSILKTINESIHRVAPAKIDCTGDDGTCDRNLFGIQAQRARRYRESPVMNQSSGTSKDSAAELDINSDESANDAEVPALLQEGTLMRKVSSAKKQRTGMLRIDAEQGYIFWCSKKSKIIPIENVKEIRSGIDARSYREKFHLSQECEDRWLTIIYVGDGQYKTLQIIAFTIDVLTLWVGTLKDLFAYWKNLNSGLGHLEQRQAVWERRCWRGALQEEDEKISLEGAEKMCKLLGANLAKEDLVDRFEEADSRNRGYLDFGDFRKFTKLLKGRPEITRLFNALVVPNSDVFDFAVFSSFMTSHQKMSLRKDELEALFRKYASPTWASKESTCERSSSPPHDNPHMETTIPDMEAELRPYTSRPEVSPNAVLPIAINHQQPVEDLSKLSWTQDAFSSFLLSADNDVFSDQHREVWHDMTRPLPEYFISSSHNTYLTGHQLIGESTIEGYIRALLHSCRCVELDIFDGKGTPIVYHGKTLTSKVSLRDICEAIRKYAFIASPYPVIITAEIHCTLPQQHLIAQIMQDTFGDSLVQAPVEGRVRIEQLPSPEDLRGKILLRARNLHLTNARLSEYKTTVGTTTTSRSTSEISTFEPSKSDMTMESNEKASADESVYVVEGKKEETQESRIMKGIHGIKAKVKEGISKAGTLDSCVIRKRILSPVGRIFCSGVLPCVPSAPPATVASQSDIIPPEPAKGKMSFALLSLLVYTVGVKCRGINEKETYAPEHVFSLSERITTRMMRRNLFDLVEHNQTHLVRIYPSGTRMDSSNFEPHKFWFAGAQLLAINWQTFDLGYMLNHVMFQRNGRAGYVLKPDPLRNPVGDVVYKRVAHILDLEIISAQQLPRRRSLAGFEIVHSGNISPYVEITLHVPDWSQWTCSSVCASTAAPPAGVKKSPDSYRTDTVKKNGFDPLWEERLLIPFDCVEGMLDLIFVQFTVKDGNRSQKDVVATYCAPLGSLQQGYRHLPLYDDAYLSQYLFSTLFVKIGLRPSTLQSLISSTFASESLVNLSKFQGKNGGGDMN